MTSHDPLLVNRLTDLRADGWVEREREAIPRQQRALRGRLAALVGVEVALLSKACISLAGDYFVVGS